MVSQLSTINKIYNIGLNRCGAIENIKIKNTYQYYVISFSWFSKNKRLALRLRTRIIITQWDQNLSFKLTFKYKKGEKHFDSGTF